MQILTGCIKTAVIFIPTHYLSIYQVVGTKKTYKKT